MESPNINSKIEEEISFKDVIISIQKTFKYLKTKLKWLILLFILGGVLGFIYTIIKRPIYIAELSFVLEEQKNGISAAAGIASQFGLELGGNGSNGVFSEDNMFDLMVSRNLIQKTLLTEVNIKGKNMTLANHYIDFNHFRSHWKGKNTLENLQFPLNSISEKLTILQDSVMMIIYKDITKNHLTVGKIDKKSSIILVKVSSESEQFSKIFIENLVNIVSKFYLETKTKREQNNVNILKHQADSVHKELDYSLLNVANSSDQNPNNNKELQKIKVPTQKEQIKVQANTAILTELVKNLELSKISLLKETPLVQIIDEPILPLEVEKPRKLIYIGLGSVLFVSIYIIYLGIRKSIESSLQ